MIRTDLCSNPNFFYNVHFISSFSSFLCKTCFNSRPFFEKSKVYMRLEARASLHNSCLFRGSPFLPYVLLFSSYALKITFFYILASYLLTTSGCCWTYLVLKIISYASSFWGIPLDHPILDSALNLGPLISRWEINKFENCWYKRVKILEILKLLIQHFVNLSSSKWDMSGPVLGVLSNNRWSGVSLVRRYILCSFLHRVEKNWSFFFPSLISRRGSVADNVVEPLVRRPGVLRMEARRSKWCILLGCAVQYVWMIILDLLYGFLLGNDRCFLYVDIRNIWFCWSDSCLLRFLLAFEPSYWTSKSTVSVSNFGNVHQLCSFVIFSAISCQSLRYASCTCLIEGKTVTILLRCNGVELRRLSASW